MKHQIIVSLCGQNIKYEIQGLLFGVTIGSAIKISQQIQNNKLKHKMRLNTT
jgi:hypothetical protein